MSVDVNSKQGRAAVTRRASSRARRFVPRACKAGWRDLASFLRTTTTMMMARGILLCLLALLPLAWSAALSSRILVVHDSTFDKADYSTFFSALTSKGHEITYRSTKESSPSLVDYEKKAFDSVFLFAPTSKCECIFAVVEGKTQSSLFKCSPVPGSHSTKACRVSQGQWKRPLDCLFRAQ